MDAIDVQLTAKDYISANRLHTGWTRIAILVAAGIVGFSLVPLYNHDAYSPTVDGRPLEPLLNFGLTALSGGFVLVIVIAILHYVVAPWRMRRIFRQQKALQRPQHIAWDDDALSVQGEGFSSRAAWSDYLKWKENGE